jgi:N6-L-threonylcarbamoyladenine synthase
LPNRFFKCLDKYKIIFDARNNQYTIDLIGGSNDLHAGQAIDRIGVKMGLKFPCGPRIEELAKNNVETVPCYNISVDNFRCNLSGLENLATKLLEKTKNLNLVSAFVLDFISKTIEKLTINLRQSYPNLQIIYAGGVMSNKIIQARLGAKFKDVYFASPEFSADNAAGIALLAKEKCSKEKR